MTRSCKKVIQCLFLGLVLSVFAGAVKSQPAPATTTGLMDAEKNQAAKENRHADALYTFSISHLSYEVTGRGSLSVRSSKSNKSLADIRLDFPSDNALISGVKYLSFQRDLIVVYDVILLNRQVQFGDKIVREDIIQRRIARFDATTLKTKWVGIPDAKSPPGEMTVAGGSIFVTGIGLIGELDLATGHYVWVHDNILQRSPPKFVVFIAPRVEGDFVYFEELRRSGSAATIQVRRRTGEIITMNYKPGP